MCTTFQLRAADGTVCVGRTMEFPDMLGARLTAIPRGVEFTSTSPSGDGHKWTTKYGVVGMDAAGQAQWLTDGINEHGLYAGGLYMPGFAEYEEPSTDLDQNLGVLDVATFVLTTCTTVAEAFTALAALTIWGPVFAPLGAAPPLHLVMHDATGAAGVVEFQGGAQQQHDNPLGVATNAPYLDWHHNNVRNWLPRMSSSNPGPVEIRGTTIAPLAQGQGFTGLPGDSGSPGRYLRATAYVMTMTPSATGADLEQDTLHALNNFDIPAGLMTGKDLNGREQDDQTKWSSVSNLTQPRYIVRLQSNPTPWAVDLATTSFDGGSPRQLELAAGGFASVAI
jgi:choloylglycine hydrolase